MKKGFLALLMLTTPAFAATDYVLEQKDPYTLQADIDLMAVPAKNGDGTINAIVEIPTGTSQKWEINKDDTSQVIWEFKKGNPRIVKYLGYPGNYGAIPGTALRLC